MVKHNLIVEPQCHIGILLNIIETALDPNGSVVERAIFLLQSGLDLPEFLEEVLLGETWPADVDYVFELR